MKKNSFHKSLIAFLPQLMQKESNDIDLCVDNMSGADFGAILRNEEHNRQLQSSNNVKFNWIDNTNTNDNNMSVVVQDSSHRESNTSAEKSEHQAKKVK